MKKNSVIFNLCVFLLVSMGCANQTSQATPELFCCIVKNPQVAELFEACQKDPEFAKSKLDNLGSHLRANLLMICNLSEKIQLKKFTKYPELFKKFFTELTYKVGETLKIGYAEMQVLADSLQIPLNNPKGQALTESDKNSIKILTTQLLNTCGSNLTDSIQKIVLFLNPSLQTEIESKKIANILDKALAALNSTERQVLGELIKTSAFKKIANNLSTLTDKALKIVKEC